MGDPMITRTFDIQAREADGKMVYEFTAATERAVDTAFGPEVLRMSGVNLKRYRANPVVLDTHNRGEISAIVGRATMKREADTLAASIEFANTERALVARQLVDDGFLRTVSVGFIPRKVKNLRKGETDGDVTGPCRIISQWELIELSLVPVPADAEALARQAYFGHEAEKDSSMKLSDIADEQRSASPAPEAQPAPTPTPEPQAREVEPTPAPAQPDVDLIAERKKVDGYIRDLGAMVGLEDVAASLIVRGVSLADARVEMAKALAERSTPVGTPEPAAVFTPEPQKPAVDAATLRDSFKRL